MEESSSRRSKKCMKYSIDGPPDEVVSSIVSFLPVKEAARTSVVARRWRYFWLCNKFLDFDGSEILRKLESRSKLLERERKRLEGQMDTLVDSAIKKMYESERLSFVDWVNRVLNMNLSVTIDEFRILFDLDNNNAKYIDRWIKFALTKKVKRLELNLVPTYSCHCFEHEQYSFPNISYPEERLRILPLDQSSCESLVSLSLTEVCITGENLDFLISSCPSLKELCVKYAHGLKIIRLGCQAIRLRHLAIIDCFELGRLEICSPNLVSCTLSGFRITMALKDVSSLINLSLRARMLEELSNNLLQNSGYFCTLETLTLQITDVLGDEGVDVLDLPTIKTLVFDCGAYGGGGLLIFTSLINAAPLLREVVLKLKWHAFDRSTSTERAETSVS